VQICQKEKVREILGLIWKEFFDAIKHTKQENFVKQIKSMDLSKIMPSMLNYKRPVKSQISIQPTKPQLVSDEENLNETFQTVNMSYKKSEESFDPEDIEIEKFEQLNEDYMTNQHKMMSSDENINNQKDKQKEEQKPKEGNPKEIMTIKDLYNSYFKKDYFLEKNSIKISPGDLILLYDNMASVLKRNISYSKFIMRKNVELEEKVRVMEQRNRMLSRELQSVSEKWKKEGKMDISR
jgi:hypothetical protein